MGSTGLWASPSAASPPNCSSSLLLAGGGLVRSWLWAPAGAVGVPALQGMGLMAIRGPFQPKPFRESLISAHSSPFPHTEQRQIICAAGLRTHVRLCIKNAKL